MRRKMILTAFVFLVLLPTAALAQQKVSVDIEKTYDFTKIKSFAVQIGTSWGNPISEKRVLGEIEQVLTLKGWTKAEPSKADATVLLHGATEKMKQLNTFYSGGAGWRWDGMGSATVTESSYTEGTLVVDIFETSSKALVFRGTATDELSTNADKNAKKLDKATTKMFVNFPPAPAPAKKK
jgi:hypothetical protein